MKKRRNQGWLPFLLGLALLLGAWLLLKLIPGLGAEHWRVVPSWPWGWAAGCSAAAPGSCWPPRP